MSDVRVLGDAVIVEAMQSGERQVGSIIIANDDGKQHGIRPRWAQVKYVGEDVKDVAVGQWLLIDHGRWTRTLNCDLEGEDLRKIEYPQSVRMISDVEPADDIMSDSTDFSKQYRV